ncbi:MAG: hypothetical protein HFE76_10550 [Firmicutes bacterium]|nr:hypothetical protein [Bacillota bacterium]
MLLKLELKKIWNPKILLFLLLAGLLFGFLFLEQSLRYFPNGPVAAAQYQLMELWTEEYGTQLDEKEHADAAERLKKELGVTDPAVDSDALDEYAKDSGELQQQWAGALYAYDIRKDELKSVLKNPAHTTAQKERASYMLKEDKKNGIIPYEVPQHATEYWRWISVFITLSVMLLLAPAVTRDTLTGVRRLQYTSRRGRKILRTQFSAMLLSATGITLVELLVFGVLYLCLGPWHFHSSPINSFFYGLMYWFDLSFGQYLGCILLIMVLLAAGGAGTAFFFSCFSRTYISLMLKIIPVFVLLAALGAKGIGWLFSFDNPMNMMTGITGIELYAAAAAFAAGMALSLIALKLKSSVSDKDTAA